VFSSGLKWGRKRVMMAELPSSLKPAAVEGVLPTEGTLQGKWKKTLNKGVPHPPTHHHLPSVALYFKEFPLLQRPLLAM